MTYIANYIHLGYSAVNMGVLDHYSLEISKKPQWLLDFYEIVKKRNNLTNIEIINLHYDLSTAASLMASGFNDSLRIIYHSDKDEIYIIIQFDPFYNRHNKHLLTILSTHDINYPIRAGDSGKIKFKYVLTTNEHIHYHLLLDGSPYQLVNISHSGGSFVDKTFNVVGYYPVEINERYYVWLDEFGITHIRYSNNEADVLESEIGRSATAVMTKPDMIRWYRMVKDNLNNDTDNRSDIDENIILNSY